MGREGGTARVGVWNPIEGDSHTLARLIVAFVDTASPLAPAGPESNHTS